MFKLRRITCLAAGAAGMYFFDPRLGKGRRAVARDKARSKMAQRQRDRRRQAAYDEGRRRGEIFERSGAGEFHQGDNQSVATHLHAVLERIDVPTADVTVEVVDDVVRLRGQVGSDDERSRVLAAVGAEAGARHVESMLHLPGEPAPNKLASRRA
jgi:BON domain